MLFFSKDDFVMGKVEQSREWSSALPYTSV